MTDFPDANTVAYGYTPICKIMRGDKDLTAKMSDRLLEITIESFDGSGSGDHAEIMLDDRDNKIAAISTDASDAAILAVFLGYRETGLFDMGTFTAHEVEYGLNPKTMRISADSVGWTTDAKVPVIASHESQTLGQLVTTLGKTAGVAVSIDPALASIVVPFTHQHSSSMHLIQELERTYGALAKFGDGYLAFTKRGTGLNASGAAIGGFTLQPENISAGYVRESARTAYSKVRASWWDKTKNQLQWVESTTAGVTGSTTPYMIKRGFSTQAQALAAANAKMGALNRGVRQGEITMSKGDASIRPGGPFRMGRFRDGVAGQYVIEHARHVLTKDGGLVTTLAFYADASDTSDQASGADDVSLDGVTIGA